MKDDPTPFFGANATCARCEDIYYGGGREHASRCRATVRDRGVTVKDDPWPTLDPTPFFGANATCARCEQDIYYGGIDGWTHTGVLADPWHGGVCWMVDEHGDTQLAQPMYVIREEP